MEEILVAIQNAANTIAAPNWADKLSVLLSLLAIFVAGAVAWRQADIADKQNKIALFEKRIEIYDILLSCSASVQIIKLADKNEDILKCLFAVLTGNPEAHREFNCNEARLYLANCSTKLQSAAFFFPEEIVPHIINVSVELLILGNADATVDSHEIFNEKKQKYFEAIKNLDENEVFSSMKAEMKMI